MVEYRFEDGEPFGELLTPAEAAQIWKLNESTIRYAILNGKFRPNEACKFGKQWIVTVSGMARVFCKCGPASYTKWSEYKVDAKRYAESNGVTPNGKTLPCIVFQYDPDCESDIRPGT